MCSHPKSPPLYSEAHSPHQILEEAAYCASPKPYTPKTLNPRPSTLNPKPKPGDPGFFYETVAPLLLIGRTSLLCISTLTGSYNFYTRLFKQIDPGTGKPVFFQIQVQLACAKCQDEGIAEKCVHLLHLVPSWQSSTRHTRLKT